MYFGQVPATAGVALASADGRVTSFGGWTSGVAWSTIKVPLTIAALRARVPGPVEPAITYSDNDTAEKLWKHLGDRAGGLVERVIREGGDSTTIVESRRLRAEYTPFGQTQWSLADQARFAAGLSQIAGASRIVGLMRNLCVEHCWGLAAKGFAAKGGWGPGLGGDYLIRQLAIVPTAFGTVGVALAAEVADGGYDAGVGIMDTLAGWVVDRLAEQ